MIAKNYIKHPEALRVQRELFFIGHHNSPLLMRLIGVMMDQRPDVPEWFKKAKDAGKALSKSVKTKISDLFEIKKTPGRKKSTLLKKSKFLDVAFHEYAPITPTKSTFEHSKEARYNR